MTRKFGNTKYLFRRKYLNLTFLLLILAAYGLHHGFQYNFLYNMRFKYGIHNKYFNFHLNTLHYSLGNTRATVAYHYIPQLQKLMVCSIELYINSIYFPMRKGTLFTLLYNSLYCFNV